jgi:intracellular septation protein
MAEEPRTEGSEKELHEKEADEKKDAPSALVDLGPLVVFFVFYKLRGIYWATGAFMVAVTVALVYAYLRERRLRPMLVVTAVIVLFFGGMTIWLGDPRFIYVKPTIVAGLTAVVLIGGLFAGRALLKPLFGTAIEMTDDGWKALSLRFAIFSAFTAGLNELVWRSVTPHAEYLWVYFKFLGIPILTTSFMLVQLLLLKRFRIESDSVAGKG